MLNKYIPLFDKLELIYDAYQIKKNNHTLTYLTNMEKTFFLQTTLWL